MEPEILIWLFPIIFMLHEFEEIILMRRWMGKNKDLILEKFPRAGQRFIRQQGSLSTEAYTFIVAEEFILASVIVIIAAVKGNYDLYAGLLAAYSIHLLLHVFQSITIGKYIPGLITTILTGIFCGFAIYWLAVNNHLSLYPFLIYSVILTVIVFINLDVMHRLAKKPTILK